MRDLIELIDLLGIGAAACKDGRHAHDRIHRGAQFVAHVGEESALGTIGRFSGFLGDGQGDRALFDKFFQMLRLRSEFGVYGTDTGRMCVAALNSKNIDYVCQAIAKVI